VEQTDDINGETVIAGAGRYSGRASLTLSPQGFEMVHPRRTIRHAWAEIAEFRTVKLNANPNSVSTGTLVVGFSFKDPAARKRHIGARIARWLMKADETIPACLERRAPELVELMERYRERYSARG
jgi:hypothetical protein